MFVTIILSSFNKRFTNEDLPALGLPMIAILVSSSVFSYLEKSINDTTASNKSPSPLACSAEIIIRLSNPNE